MLPFPETELILTPEKRVYHLNLRGEDIADNVILVGDQNRVTKISAYFSKIDFKTSHREFISHTGTFNGKRITVISTGIGPDNMDIVLNELDAAVNIDPETRIENKTKRSLNIFRLGTSGGLQPDIPVNAIVASAYGLGLDGLLNFYKDADKINEDVISGAFIKHTNWPVKFSFPYCIKADENLMQHFNDGFFKGITATAPGFYAPQGRQLRLAPEMKDLNKRLTDFRLDDLRITNFEMETSAIYGLGKLLGHRCLTFCVVIANRVTKEFTNDYEASVELLIKNCLNKISDIK